MVPKIKDTDMGGLTLDQLLCFELHAASRAMTAVYRPILEDLGLTYPQYLVMVLLWEEEPRLVKELGRAMDLDSGTLSPLLKRLAAAGLVQRTRSTQDEREVEVTLTEEGWSLEGRARSVRHSIECATGLSEAEINDLLERLAGLRSALRATLRETTAG